MAHNSKNRELLLTGYVRSNCGTECPIDLINFLSEWINLRNGVVFKFFGDELATFYNTQEDQAMKHENQEEYYTIHLPEEISISCKIYPRNIKRDYERIMFELSAFAPKTISIFEYYLEIRCKEMDNWIYKAIVTSNTEYINPQKRYSYPLSVLEQSNKEIITFYVYAELLRIMERETLTKKTFMKDVTINAKIKHKWILDEKLLIQLRDDRFEGVEHYLESVENDCIGLYVISKKKKKRTSYFMTFDSFYGNSNADDEKENESQLIAGIYIFKIPTKPDGIQGRLSVSILSKNVKTNDIKEVDWETYNDDIYVEFGAYKECKTNMSLNGVNRIKIEMSLDITKVRSDSEYIDKDQWHLYGIL